MKQLKSYEIRQLWFDFFESKGHDIIPSAPLIPQNDPTLLWINAGVAPLKKYFDGTVIPNNRRMANSQKSIRTNDIENVGRTARHHTFFEMLGNFSIGDYFRTEALEWAFEFLTSDEWLGIPLNKLYFTVYPTDEESVEEWIRLGVDPARIIKSEGNFWEIGEGPCGPNTEIFFDRGEEYDPNNLGLQLLIEDLPNDRYIEIWNIVFSQYNAKEGLSREQYPELPSKNIDTGMGLERVACIMQNVETNYDTDLFIPIMDEISRLTNIPYEGQMAFKVIADHVRSVVFALTDGADISNEGRGYVIRRVLRRAIRYGKSLGMNEPFLHKLVSVVVFNMKEYYPELADADAQVTMLIKNEEEKFLETLDHGEKRLLEYIKSNDQGIVDGKMAFLLYDTFGFPLELTIEVANEHGLRVDEATFYDYLKKQKEQSRSSRNVLGSLDEQNKQMLEFTRKSKFVGYDTLSAKSTINGIFKHGNLVDEGSKELLLVFRETPFYGQSGGQVGDKGIVRKGYLEYQVLDTVKLPNDQNACLVNVGSDVLKIGDEVTLEVDRNHRANVIKNHSATHLLNYALREVLGSHVKQQGSSLNDKTLRFDFNHYNMPTNEEIIEVERIVNDIIKLEKETTVEEMPIDDAKAKGAIATFGEKYGEMVRVVSMFESVELCGGTHVSNTGDIKEFAIINIESKGSGIYRIEAATDKNIKDQILKSLAPINEEIINLNMKAHNIIAEAQELNLNVEFNEVVLEDLVNSYQSIIKRQHDLSVLRLEVKELDKNFTKLKRDNTVIDIDEFNNLVKVVNEKKILITKTNELDSDVLKDLADRINDSLADVVLLANIIDDKIIFVAKSKIKEVNAGKIVKEVAMITGGRGGGRADFAQAGGNDITKLDEALSKVYNIIEEVL